jgi:hypothetical protein
MVAPKPWGLGDFKDGRPPKLNQEQKQEVWEAFAQYIKRTKDPTIVGFTSSNKVALAYWVSKHDLNNWQDFNALRARCIEKSEQYLLKHTGNGSYNSSIGKLRLTQPAHGYVQRVDTDITSGGDKIETRLSGSQISQLIRTRAKRANS